MQELHLDEDEPTRTPVPKIEFEFENFSLTTQQLKGNILVNLDLIYE